MYKINLKGTINNNDSDINENFTNVAFNCDYSMNQTTTITNSNAVTNINTECLIVPSRVFNGNNKKNLILSIIDKNCKDNMCSKSGYHGFQIFPFNLINNIIFIDIIKPNFFCMINTKNMQPNGEIKIVDPTKIKLIKLTNLENNDNKITTTDLNGNICSDPNSKLSRFTYTQDQVILNNSLKYDKNPIIYLFGDYNACNMQKQLSVNNLYIYFDYGINYDYNTCLNKMKFNIATSGNNTVDFKLPYTMHGTQYNDNKSTNFIINFDPRDMSFRDGFITIINTNYKILNNIVLGNISFSKDIINNLMKLKRDCLYIKFWIVSFNFKKDKIISIENKQGPYNNINFIGNPKIIIYIPQFKSKYSEENIIKPNDLLYQTNENSCDIYVNISY